MEKAIQKSNQQAQPLPAQKWARRVDFFALSVWLAFSLLLAASSYVMYGVDFRGYYAAARVFLAGGNPYDYHQVARVLLSVTGKMGNNPYFYPPWFVWLFIPLAGLPFQAARALWMLVNLLAWSLGLWKLGEFIAWPAAGWKRYVLFILATFAFAWLTWIFEQAGILIFAILVGLLFSIRAQKWVLTGVLLSLLLVKPNVTLLVAGALCLWLVLNHHWKPVWVFLGVSAALLVTSTLLMPGWYQPFFAPGFGQGLRYTLDGPDKIGFARILTTLPYWLGTLGLAGRLAWSIYAVCAAGALLILFLTVRTSKSLVTVTSVALLASFIATPYALQYDYPALVIVLFGALSTLAAKRAGRLAGYALAGLVCSQRLWLQDLSGGFWIVIGLTLLQAWAYYISIREA